MRNFLKYIFFLFLFIPSLLIAQNKKKPTKKTKQEYGHGQGYLNKNKKRNDFDVFPLETKYRLGGWLFGIGPTYMLAYPGDKDEIVSNLTDTAGSSVILSNNYDALPRGRFGLMAELGWFHSFRRPKGIEYIDFGLSYKMLRGSEKFIQQNWINNVMLSETEIKQTFSDHFLSLHFNAVSQRHINGRLFITNALGVNFDYTLIPNRSGGLALPKNGGVTFPVQMPLQLHYKFGFGIRAKERLLIVPTLEMPVFNILAFTHIVSTHPYFNSRYRPMLISVRFMFIRKTKNDCPPVYNPAGVGPDGKSPKLKGVE
ncbi:hypothetical protein FLAV_00194 [Flavobacteriales bacterium]|nr:hypothetical protein [Flavobacteriales bacterium]MCL4815256.1 hypothetical protein [Flavobacteriales bacterium]WKZ75690.1 MAG: hypothetical protein QY303_02105 [Vicingaceae bacterium]GIK69109.1 MAG: hypothetical protein BroJett020_04040 [Bacteroidota bacterium]CAG0950954.1 hypothetical protein FLAV_00194 [Flavobacteriales bacterium]